MANETRWNTTRGIPLDPQIIAEAQRLKKEQNLPTVTIAYMLNVPETTLTPYLKHIRSIRKFPNSHNPVAGAEGKEGDNRPIPYCRIRPADKKKINFAVDSIPRIYEDGAETKSIVKEILDYQVANAKDRPIIPCPNIPRPTAPPTKEVPEPEPQVTPAQAMSEVLKMQSMSKSKEHAKDNELLKLMWGFALSKWEERNRRGEDARRWLREHGWMV